MDEALSTTESERLGELKGVIRDGMDTFVRVGTALLEIRDGKLWRATSPTFEAFCQTEFGFTHRRANQLIEAASVAVELVGNNCSQNPIIKPEMQIPANEGQARPLASLPTPAAKREAWKEAIDTAPKDKAGNPKVTAKHVEKVVAKRRAETDAPAEPKTELTTPADPQPQPEIDELEAALCDKQATDDPQQPWADYNAIISIQAASFRDIINTFKRLMNDKGETGVFASWLSKAHITNLEGWVATLENQKVAQFASTQQAATLSTIPNTGQTRHFLYVGDPQLKGKKKKGRAA